MKVLLDENLPHQLRAELPGHEVFTVQFMGWRGIKNGELLAQAAAAEFDAFVTIDKNLPYEQNPQMLPVAVLVIYAKSNRFGDLLAFVPRVLIALNHLKPKTIVHID
jgi:predicted nuclease of predicted toxin-antitoxin system